MSLTKHSTKPHTQSILISKEKFTKPQALAIIKKGYKNEKMEICDNFYKFQQKKQNNKKFKYETKDLIPGVKAMIAIPIKEEAKK